MERIMSELKDEKNERSLGNQKENKNTQNNQKVKMVQKDLIKAAKENNKNIGKEVKMKDPIKAIIYGGKFKQYDIRADLKSSKNGAIVEQKSLLKSPLSDDKYFNDEQVVYTLEDADGNIYMDNIEPKALKAMIKISGRQQVDEWLRNNNDMWNGYFVSEKNKYGIHRFAKTLNSDKFRYYVRDDGVCFKQDLKTRDKLTVHLIIDEKGIYPCISEDIKECKKYCLNDMLKEILQKPMSRGMLLKRMAETKKNFVIIDDIKEPGKRRNTKALLKRYAV